MNTQKKFMFPREFIGFLYIFGSLLFTSLLSPICKFSVNFAISIPFVIKCIPSGGMSGCHHISAQPIFL